MIKPADENPYIIWDFKIARSDWSQNFTETAKNDGFDRYMYTSNNKSVF